VAGVLSKRGPRIVELPGLPLKLSVSATPKVLFKMLQEIRFPIGTGFYGRKIN
tara:strand:- start:553 stop:711 length:159 start_codon:yes stop_codon:yes gene_type:complete